MRFTRLITTASALLLCVTAAADTLLVVRKTDNALDFMDPGSGLRLASVPLGLAPHEVSVSPDGRRAVVSNYGTGERPGSTLSVIDLVQPAELKRIELGSHTRPHGVAWYAPDRIAVTTEGSASLLVVDPDDGRIVSAVGTGQQTSHMVAVSSDGTRAYVANIGSGTTTAIDLVAGRKLADIVTGRGSEGLALTKDGRQLWVGARAEDRISVVDTGSLAIVDSVPVAGVPIRIAMSPDGRRAYVTSAAASTVTAIDVATREPALSHRVEVPLAPGAAERPFARLAPGSALPVGLIASPATGAVYVASTMGDKVLVLAPMDLSSVRSVDVGGEPDGLGITATLPKAACHGCEKTP
jgi:DNA-binding beta-propeller fold protein YncE